MLPDPIQRGEASCEDWYFDNVKGDIATCGCGREFKLSDGETVSADPYAIPICPTCFQEWWETKVSEQVNAIMTRIDAEYTDLAIAQLVDAQILEYVDADWDEDDFDTEYEWYMEFCHGEAEDDVMNDLLKEFEVPEELIESVTEALQEKHMCLDY